MLEARIKVTGTVQGVFYRANCKEQADLLGVNGWVKNETDGSVSILAQGDQRQILEFIDWCKEGPPVSEVEDCQVSIKENPSKVFDEFEVR